MKNIYKIKLFLVLCVGTLLVSCDEGGDPDPGATEVVDMAGDWYVELLVDGEDIYGIGYSLISTYNTAADNGQEMWIDDHHNIWDFKVKVPVNVSNSTFSGTDLNSVVEDYEISVDITDGQIWEDAATTSGGNVADSISFNIEFEDDPGTIYTIAGYKRTGFLEDEH